MRLSIYTAFLLCLAAPFFIVGCSSKNSPASQACANQMWAVTFSIKLWSEDHNGKLPTAFKVLAQTGITPDFLVCPSKGTPPSEIDWDDLQARKEVYILTVTGNGEPVTKVIVCPVHNLSGYIDGGVRDAEGKIIPKRL